MVVGTGLIGGSVGLALRSAGWNGVDMDASAEVVARALESGASDASREPGRCGLAVIPTPVSRLG